jgi:hypothetical protein
LVHADADDFQKAALAFGTQALAEVARTCCGNDGCHFFFGGDFIGAIQPLERVTNQPESAASNTTRELAPISSLRVDW